MSKATHKPAKTLKPEAPKKGIRLLCRLGWHKWSKWTTYSGVYTDRKITFIRQRRCCLCCGELQDVNIQP